MNKHLEEDDFEMPTPCQKCGKIFDLNDGCGSELWFPNTVICERCGDIEEKIVELESEKEDVALGLENAKWDVNHYTNRLAEIEAEIQKLDQ